MKTRLRARTNPTPMDQRVEVPSLDDLRKTYYEMLDASGQKASLTDDDLHLFSELVEACYRSLPDEVPGGLLHVIVHGLQINDDGARVCHALELVPVGYERGYAEGGKGKKRGVKKTHIPAHIEFGTIHAFKRAGRVECSLHVDGYTGVKPGRGELALRRDALVGAGWRSSLEVRGEVLEEVYAENIAEGLIRDDELLFDRNTNTMHSKYRRGWLRTDSEKKRDAAQRKFLRSENVWFPPKHLLDALGLRIDALSVPSGNVVTFTPAHVLHLDDSKIGDNPFDGEENADTLWAIFQDLVEACDQANDLLAEGHEGEDGGPPTVDVRLQLLADGSAYVHIGDAQYDQDHEGYWAAGYVQAEEQLSELRETARQLLQEAMDARDDDDDDDDD